MPITFRPFQETDQASALQLNAESVAVLSPLDAARLALLNSQAQFHLVAEHDGAVVGFLLGFADGAIYDSMNYQWFASRFKRFLYIDRVVVNPAFRGSGIGQAFYREAEAQALTQGFAWMVCEIDIEPPNHASLAFHQRMGFVEVGRQSVGSGKIVSLQARSLQ